MVVSTLVLLYIIIPILIVGRYYSPARDRRLQAEFIRKIQVPQKIIYSKAAHREWKAVKINHPEGSIAGHVAIIYLESGDVVVCPVSRRMKVFVPPNAVISNLDIVGYPTPDKEKLNLYIVYYSIFLVVASPFVDYWVRYDKAANDPLRLARIKSATSYNQIVKTIDAKLDSVLDGYGYVYVYTNDSFLVEAFLTINYDVAPNYSIIDFVNTNSITYDLNNFLSRQDTLGYNISIKVRDNWRRIQNINQVDGVKQFKVLNDYFWTDKENEHYEEWYAKKKHYSFEKKRERHQGDIVVLDETELANHQPESNLKVLWQPKVDLSRSDMLFYFVSYNRPMTESQLEDYLHDFREMYLKKQKCPSCTIKKVNIIKHFAE